MEDKTARIHARIMAILEEVPYSIQNEAIIQAANTIRKEREQQLDLAQLSVEQYKKILLSTPILEKIEKNEANPESEK